jgi:dimeric dUTPase (all-alpha-NTP-PPase superfamily)
MLTNKNLVDLAKKQVLLDNFIEEKLVDKNSQVLFKKRLVAFLVELGEYANEERAFKF